MPQLLDWLAERHPTAKRTTLREMIKSGRVRVNGEPAISAKHSLKPSDDVRVLPRQTPRPAAADLPFPVVYEDEDVLVINKPPGLLTSTTDRERRLTAWALVKQYLALREARARPGLIHRLDRDASGLLIFSKSSSAFASLKGQFSKHSVERVYMALTDGVPNPREGMIDSRLIELPDGRVVTTRGGKGQRAVTEYQVVATSAKIALLRVRLQTGRKHQIRAQLAQRGTPILNDPMYGKGNPTGQLMLIATELVIDHPRTAERMTFRIDPPDEMLRVTNPKNSREIR